MSETKLWSVELVFDERGDRTDAEAILQIAGNRFAGWGRARRNPTDPDVPKIGEELAAARALSDLSLKLVEAAAEAIERFEGHRVRVHT